MLDVIYQQADKDRRLHLLGKTPLSFGKKHLWQPSLAHQPVEERAP
jgi:hypothetical protein